MNYKEIPKAELHCHLEGCFRPETVMEIGNTLGMDIPQDPAVFREEWLLSKPLENLEVALKRFVDIQKVWCSEEVIERLTFEACEDAVEQGIRIMEFRYAPDFIAFDKPHLSFERIHERSTSSSKTPIPLSRSTSPIKTHMTSAVMHRSSIKRGERDCT
jgi:adenosine deaminase